MSLIIICLFHLNTAISTFQELDKIAIGYRKYSYYSNNFRMILKRFLPNIQERECVFIEEDKKAKKETQS